MTAEPIPALCADCGIRPHSATCWRCAECQARHEANAERRAPRPTEVP